MLITLAIGSIMGQTGVIVTIICDQNPHWKRWVVTTVVCSAVMTLVQIAMLIVCVQSVLCPCRLFSFP